MIATVESVDKIRTDQVVTNHEQDTRSKVQDFSSSENFNRKQRRVFEAKMKALQKKYERGETIHLKDVEGVVNYVRHHVR